MEDVHELVEQKIGNYHPGDPIWQIRKNFLDFVDPERVILVVIPFMVEVLLNFKPQVAFNVSVIIEPF